MHTVRPYTIVSSGLVKFALVKACICRTNCKSDLEVTILFLDFQVRHVTLPVQMSTYLCMGIESVKKVELN